MNRRFLISSWALCCVVLLSMPIGDVFAARPGGKPARVSGTPGGARASASPSFRSVNPGSHGSTAFRPSYTPPPQARSHVSSPSTARYAHSAAGSPQSHVTVNQAPAGRHVTMKPVYVSPPSQRSVAAPAHIAAGHVGKPYSNYRPPVSRPTTGTPIHVAPQSQRIVRTPTHPGQGNAASHIANLHAPVVPYATRNYSRSWHDGGYGPYHHPNHRPAVILPWWCPSWRNTYAGPYSSGDYGNYGYSGLYPSAVYDATYIQIVNPATLGVTVSYALDGQQVILQPGEIQTLDRRCVITFDRGNGYGWTRLVLTGGTYMFGLGPDGGWTLFRT